MMKSIDQIVERLNKQINNTQGSEDEIEIIELNDDDDYEDNIPQEMSSSANDIDNQFEIQKLIEETAREMFNRAGCPMPDQCMNSNMVYRYQVTRLDSNTTETYTGSTVGFKQRHDKHMKQMEDERNGSTTLSSHVKSLRSSNVPYNINWNFKERAAPYNAITGWCRLCTLECYHILFNIEDASLNQRSEFFSALLS